VRLEKADVVRHGIVQRIIAAYEKHEAASIAKAYC
jgi:phosphate starvation-inducible protein PhoH